MVATLMDSKHGPDLMLGDFFDDLDIHGHHEEKGVTVSSRHSDVVVRMLDIVVQSMDTPYQTRGDALRDAVWFFLKAWNAKLIGGDSMLNAHMLNEQIKRDASAARKHHMEVDERMHDIQEQLTIILTAGDLEEAHRAIVGYWEAATKITIPYWRNHYVNRLVNLAIIKATCRLLKTWGMSIPADLASRVGV